MKKISVIALILAVVMCFSVMTACGKSTGDKDSAPKGMKLASGRQTDADVDYLMYVPEAWRVDRSDLYTSAYFSSGDATSISTTAYSINGDIAKVDDWWKTFEKQMKEVYTDVSKIEAKDAKIDGVKGREYSFTAKLNGQEYCFIITAVIKNYYVYYITYTSTPEFTENHLEEREQVIDAFKFTD